MQLKPPTPVACHYHVYPIAIRPLGHDGRWTDVCLGHPRRQPIPPGLRQDTRRWEEIWKSLIVKSALSCIDSHLIVSKYQLEAPTKSDLQRFLEENRGEINEGT